MSASDNEIREVLQRAIDHQRRGARVAYPCVLHPSDFNPDVFSKPQLVTIWALVYFEDDVLKYEAVSAMIGDREVLGEVKHDTPLDRDWETRS